MVKRHKYHIQLKRTRLVLDDQSDQTLQNYKLVFGEPVYLNNENRLTIGPAPATGRSTPIPDCKAVKFVAQSITDPDNSEQQVSVVDNGVHYKNRDNRNIVNLTDNVANTIYPITTMAAVTSDGTYELSEYLIHKLNIDKTTLVASPSLGVDSLGVFVHEFTPVEVPNDLAINANLANIVNSKVSIDDDSAVVDYLSLGTGADIITGKYYYDGRFYTTAAHTQEIDPEIGNIYRDEGSLPDEVYYLYNGDTDSYTLITNELAAGVDLIGAYVRINDGSAEELNYIKAYIDAMLANSLSSRLLSLEGNIYYLQELLNNINFLHVGATPPQENNKLWIDTTTLTGGLKYCSNKTTNTWSHVPVAYT